jgi:hypothetical protein
MSEDALMEPLSIDSGGANSGAASEQPADFASESHTQTERSHGGQHEGLEGGLGQKDGDAGEKEDHNNNGGKEPGDANG